MPLDDTDPLPAADDDTLTGDDKIVNRARRRFKRCRDYESTARENYHDDVKFATADDRNGYQWPDGIASSRAGESKPCLTINVTRQHCLQVINDARQNKPGVNIHPTGGGATEESAQVFEGLARHIEYQSNAQAAYDNATWHQVVGGIGWWRVVTDYLATDSFDQEIYIRRIADPMSVYLDPDIQEADGSDAKFGFVFKDMSREDFNAQYPSMKDDVPHSTLGEDDGWCDRHHVRVAEYYERSERKDRLIAVQTPQPDGSMQTDMLRASKVPKAILDQIPPEQILHERPIVEDDVTWYLIIGNKIQDTKSWPGKYIPLVRVVGEESTIDGQLDRKGHTRACRDAQRFINYWTSSAVEHVALQTKTPWIIAQGAIEGLEAFWNTANIDSLPYLPYNHVSLDGNEPLPPPTRIEPPQMPQAYLAGLAQAERQMMQVTGQFQAEMGEPSNERSGVAIQQRQRQGDNATYHFIDRLSQAIRYTGRIIVDLVPKIYDTPRVVRILAEDGSQQQIQLDPNAKKAFEQAAELEQKEVAAIFNPLVGRYDVEADVGPSYATRRQEAFNAFTQIVSQNKELTNVVGDLLFKNADFPGAEELSERLERMVPPQAKGEAPPPALVQAQQQNQVLQEQVKTLLQQLADAGIKDKNRDAVDGLDHTRAQMDQYRAETDRMKAVGAIDPEAMKPVLRQLISEALGTPIVPLMGAHTTAEQTFIPPDPVDPQAAQAGAGNGG